MTINKLSIMSRITHSTLESIVNGKSKSPTVSTVKKICDGLDIKLVDFFDDKLFDDLEQEIR